VVVRVHEYAQPQLMEVVQAFHPPRRFPRVLDGRQQHGDQHSDDRDNDQQFDEGETM